MTLFPVLDHIAINVRENLDESVDLFARLGFSLTPRGYHSMGSANHLAVFATDYIELLGLPPNPSVIRKDLMAWPCGINGLVFSTEDTDYVARDLTSKDVPVMPVSSFNRPVALPDGTEENARFRTLTLDRAAVDYGRVYFCQHYSRHLVWRDEYRQHRNGVVATESVVISARDPNEAAGVFRRMFGADAVRKAANGFTMPIGLGRLDIVDTASADAMFGPTSGAIGPTFMKAVVLRTRSLDAARGAVGSLAGEFGGDRVVVPADRAFAAAIEFVG